MSAREMINPHRPRFPIKVKKTEDLKVAETELFKNYSETIQEQYKKKLKFSDKVKFLRFIGLAE